jgi:glycosyltransferase involved in cell wall biosynthesis
MEKSSDKKTILIVTTSYGPGGAERMIATLSSALNQDQYRVIVGLSRPGWLQDECRRLNVQTRTIPLEGSFHIQWFKTCFELIRAEKVALIHAHEFSAIVYGWIVARLAGVPFVGTVHGKNYYWEKLRRRLAYRIVSRSGKLVTVSEDLKRFLISAVGLSEERIQVIYNGIGNSSSVSDGDVDRCRTELGLKQGDPVIGAVGSLYPVKGHTYLLDAMPALIRQHPNIALLLIGSGDLEVPLKEQANRRGIEQRVRFLGLREDIPRLLAVMDVFVLPSLSEGHSIALLEAMLAGRPVVASRVGGNSELVLEGETGILVPSKDPDALTEALHRLLDNRAMREAFGHRATRRVQEQFSASLMTDGYKRLYNDLLGHNEGRVEWQH